jgi:hypothetical protein
LGVWSHKSGCAPRQWGPSVESFSVSMAGLAARSARKNVCGQERDRRTKRLPRVCLLGTPLDLAAGRARGRTPREGPRCRAPRGRRCGALRCRTTRPTPVRRRVWAAPHHGLRVCSSRARSPGGPRPEHGRVHESKQSCTLLGSGRQRTDTWQTSRVHYPVSPTGNGDRQGGHPMALCRFAVKHLGRLTATAPVAQHVAYIMGFQERAPENLR